MALQSLGIIGPVTANIALTILAARPAMAMILTGSIVADLG